ncbi:MAG: hypothetical protein JNK82_00610, partial [Myxococcaceae bacterium]|nr:hypothetical protein [Myxococcaceae bacterium]
MNFVRLALVSAVVFTAACNKEPEVVPPPPSGVVTSFTATPGTVTAPGQMVTLAWATTDAKRVTLEQVGKGPLGIDPAAASGSTQVTITANTTFVLMAQGEGGTDSKVLTVTVSGTKAGVIFSASPTHVGADEATTLVWSVPGATTLEIRPMGGAPLDLRGQGAAGSVLVRPTADTRYVLTAGATTASVDVSVTPRIVSLTASASPLPGQPITVSWQVRGGGSRLTLTRAGAAMPLVTETMPAAIAQGSFMETAPNLAPDSLLTYTLTVEHGAERIEQVLVVRIGGNLRVTVSVPLFVTAGTPFTLGWTTVAANQLEVLVDGVTLYVAPDAARVAAGSVPMEPIDHAVHVRVIARDDKGGVVTVDRTVETVGVPTFVS